jgi:hypothetical protein
MALVPTVLTSSSPNVRRSVDLNFYPPSSAARSDFWSGTGNSGGLMMARSVLWASKKTSGTIRLYFVHFTTTVSWVTDVLTNISNYVSSSLPGVTINITTDQGGANIGTFNPANFDVIMASLDSAPFPSTVGTTMNSFAAAGGGIIITVFANYGSGNAIPNFTYATYSPISTIGTSASGTLSMNTANIVTHPVTTGLSSVTFSTGTAGFISSGNTTFTSDSQTLVRSTTGISILTVREVLL